MRSYKNVVFLGLPGTGKTTARSAHEASFEYDFGMISRIDKDMLKRMAETLTSLLDNYPVVVSTYPDYLEGYRQDTLYYVAIPKLDDKELILDRVFKRDKNKTFYHLYKKNFEKWISDWDKKYSSIPKNIIRVEFFDNDKIFYSGSGPIPKRVK